VSPDLHHTLRQWIRDHLLDGQAPDGFDEDTDLIALGAMDSLAIMRTLAYLEGALGIMIGDGDSVPEHFAGVPALADVVADRR
jgi:acyl carrier protein